MSLIATAADWREIPMKCQGCQWSGPFTDEDILWLLDATRVAPRRPGHGEYTALEAS